MHGTISRHVADHLAAPISFGVVCRCIYSAVVTGLNTVRRSSRDAECKAQCSNGPGQAPMLHFGFSLFGVVSSSWRSPRRHCPVQRTPSCSRSWGTSISTLHAGRWSPCVQTFSRISRNDIGRSAWAQTQQMIAGGKGQFTAVANLGKVPTEAVALKHRSDHTQRPSMPEDAQLLR
jgi:hypothetical protein